MRSARSARGRHAELAYGLDRSLPEDCSVEDFARAAVDVLRLGLRPAYAALACRSGSSVFHRGDQALAADLDRLLSVAATAPRSFTARPRTLARRDSAPAALAPLQGAMAASAIDLLYPLVHDGALLGLVAIGPRADRGAWTTEDLEFCDRIGARLAAVAARQSLAAEVSMLRAATAAYERLASIGQIAAGIAHEIRNPLVSIRTFTQLLPERHADEEFRSGFLDLTLAEIDRISTLVGELLSYARPAPADPGEASETVDVGDCLERTCLLLRSHARGAGVLLDFEAEDDLPLAAICEDKLRQVVINLVVNGIQACDGRGRVRVRAARKEPFVAVEVRDDGPGMDPTVAARIFEPFFTTRREGTGLGLALVRRILDEAGGAISVETRLGEGASFLVLLATAARQATRCEDGAGFDVFADGMADG